MTWPPTFMSISQSSRRMREILCINPTGIHTGVVFKCRRCSSLGKGAGTLTATGATSILIVLHSLIIPFHRPVLVLRNCLSETVTGVSNTSCKALLLSLGSSIFDLKEYCGGVRFVDNYMQSLRLCLRVLTVVTRSQSQPIQDCSKIHSEGVEVRNRLWESPSNSHAIAIQWVHMVKDPPVTILHVHSGS